MRLPAVDDSTTQRRIFVKALRPLGSSDVVQAEDTIALGSAA